MGRKILFCSKLKINDVIGLLKFASTKDYEINTNCENVYVYCDLRVPFRFPNFKIQITNEPQLIDFVGFVWIEMMWYQKYNLFLSLKTSKLTNHIWLGKPSSAEKIKVKRIQSFIWFFIFIK